MQSSSCRSFIILRPRLVGFFKQNRSISSNCSNAHLPAAHTLSETRYYAVLMVRYSFEASVSFVQVGKREKLLHQKHFVYVFNQNASVSYSCNLYYGTTFFIFSSNYFRLLLIFLSCCTLLYVFVINSKKAYNLLAAYDVYIIQLYNVYTPIPVLKYISLDLDNNNLHSIYSWSHQLQFKSSYPTAKTA